MLIGCAARTDQGYRRDKNEDCYLADLDRNLFVICDGIGGHPAGEVASRKAIEFVVEYFDLQKELGRLPTGEDDNFIMAGKLLCVQAVEYANRKIIELGKSSPELDGMATTMTLVIVVEGVGFVGHVGDSRLYIKHSTQAKQLTDDHTMLEEFSRVNPAWLQANRNQEALGSFRHVLTRCVGREADVAIDSFSIHLANNDTLLLCTDGLSNYFKDEATIVRLLDDRDDEACLTDGLVQFANEAGGSDNITAVVIRITALDESQYGDFIVRPGRDGITNMIDWSTTESRYW